MFQKIFQQIWQWLKNIYQNIYQKWFYPTNENSYNNFINSEFTAVKPLSDAECENYFLQMLEGVNKGWDWVQINRFFVALENRATLKKWTEWLQKFGEKNLKSTTTNHELGRRLLLFSERSKEQPELKDLGAIANQIAQELLARKITENPEVSQDKPSAAIPAETLNINPIDSNINSNPNTLGQWGYISNSQILTTYNQEISNTNPTINHPEAENISLPVQEYQNYSSNSYYDYNAEQWFEHGLKQLDNHDYNGALSSFHRTLELNIYHYKAWHNLGNVLSHLGRNQEAINAYDRALAIKPDLSPAWNNKGDILFDLGQTEAAIASYNRSLEIQPNNAETWFNRGMAFSRLALWEEAITSWDKSLEIKPNDYETWFNRGLALGALEKWQEAIISWDKALEIKPDLQDAWVNKGIAFQKLGKYTEAIAANNQAIWLQNNRS